MSFAPPDPLIEPAVRPLAPDAVDPAVPDAVPDAVEPDVEPEAVPEVEPEPLALVPAELEPDELVLPLAVPIFAFFNTKLPPAPALLDGLPAALLELLALLSRCRQPVAVTCPATSLDERVGWLLDVLGVGWLLDGLELGGLLGGVDEGGVCAASVPHSAMPLHSVTAHCQ
jgi:hypothetical protein